MRDPQLSPSHFSKDHLVFSNTIVDAEGFASASAATLSEGICTLTGMRRIVVEVRPASEDLSPYDRLTLTARNRSPAQVLVGIELLHTGASHESEESVKSFSGGREPLPTGSWTTLAFPVEGFGSYGRDPSWSKVEKIRIAFGFDRDHVGPERVQVDLLRLDGERRIIPEGPRLTDAGLRHVLGEDPDCLVALLRGTDQVRGDRGVVSTALSCYAPTNSEIFFPPPHPYPQESPREIIRGRVMGQNVGIPIPWRSNPLGVQEWTHFLNRHHFARELVKAFAETRSEIYVRAIAQIVESWIRDNPVPLGSNGGAGPAWETLSTAWRLREWLWIAGIVWESSFFPSRTIKTMLRSIWEHATSLLDHVGHPNNWLFVESAALTLAGLCFPWFNDASRWREVGVERLRIAVEAQFFDDGVHFEISPLYHAICLHCLIEVKSAAEAAKVPLPQELTSSEQRMGEYLVALCRPDFTWPSLNDSGGYLGNYSQLMARMGEVYNRQDFMWLGSQGRLGAPPRIGFRAFPSAGIATMRSHDGPDANFLVLRTGPAGAAHVHDDVLSLEVAALGRPRLVDPGVTSYAPDPLTDHYRSAGSHSTILINGKGAVRSKAAYAERIRPAEAALSCAACQDLQVAEGHCPGPWEGSSDCAVTRSVLFVKGEYWLVFDTVVCPIPEEVAVNWQFSPGRVEMDPATSAAICRDARGAGLKLFPLLGRGSHVEIATGATVPPRGWVSLNGTDVPAPSFRYIIPTVMRATLAWALVPFAGPPSSEIEALRLDRPDLSLRIEIAFPRGYRDEVDLATGPVRRAADAEGFLKRLSFRRSMG